MLLEKHLDIKLMKKTPVQYVPGYCCSMQAEEMDSQSQDFRHNDWALKCGVWNTHYQMKAVKQSAAFWYES